MNDKGNRFNDSELVFYTVPLKPGISIPFVEGQVSAGFPSPSDNYLQGELDLNSLLINNLLARISNA